MESITHHLQTLLTTLHTQPISLAATGLLALADLNLTQARTARTGTASLLDILVLTPGLHLQQKATTLNQSEYPVCGALTTGYVFRVENQATVYYLQNIGRAGQLTTLAVKNQNRYPSNSPSKASKDREPRRSSKYDAGKSSSVFLSDSAASAAFALAAAASPAVMGILVVAGEAWGVLVLAMFMLARALNVWVVRCRSVPGWFGQPEPGVEGDLLILLSQDRWVRMQGMVDDLKAVTSGIWLRDSTMLESFLTAVATIVTFLAAGLLGNVSLEGTVLIMGLLMGSAGLLAVSNAMGERLWMHGRTVEVVGARKQYRRRLDLGRELIEETGRDDWAVRMGIMNEKDSKSKASTDGGVKM